MILINHPLFKEDLQQAVEYDNLQREGLTDNLFGEVELTIRKMAKNPELYPKTYEDVRRASLKRFKWYSVRYQIVAPVCYERNLFKLFNYLTKQMFNLSGKLQSSLDRMCRYNSYPTSRNFAE